MIHTKIALNLRRNKQKILDNWELFSQNKPSIISFLTMENKELHMWLHKAHIINYESNQTEI